MPRPALAETLRELDRWVLHLAMQMWPFFSLEEARNAPRDAECHASFRLRSCQFFLGYDIGWKDRTSAEEERRCSVALTFGRLQFP